MARKDNQSLKRLTLTLRYVTSPDAETRLSRAIDILLENANRKQDPPAGRRKHRKEKPHAQISDHSGLGVRK